MSYNLFVISGKKQLFHLPVFQISRLREVINMPNYEQLYFQLFAAAANAVEAIEALNYGQAREILITAQQSAEEQCISTEG